MLKYSIVAVEFPFSDQLSETKLRPVLCLTDPLGKYDEVIIAYITSKIPFDKLDSDIDIKKTSKEFTQTGLLHNSTIRLHKLMTISKNEITGSLGVLPQNLRKEVGKTIVDLF
jgi:mRNA interferase MazF